ncbi:MAG TPA: hypothetical protein VGD14_13410, partial [bacterium]
RVLRKNWENGYLASGRNGVQIREGTLLSTWGKIHCLSDSSLSYGFYSHALPNPLWRIRKGFFLPMTEV